MTSSRDEIERYLAVWNEGDFSAELHRLLLTGKGFRPELWVSMKNTYIYIDAIVFL